MGVASWAFTISIVALLWNIGSTWLRWPRVAVVIRQSVTVHATAGNAPPVTTPDATESYKLIVLNTGAEAVTIANVGLTTLDNSVRLDMEREAALGHTQTFRDGPDIPFRLDGHGSASWTIDEDHLIHFAHKSQVYGYAQRYRNFRKYPKRNRTMIRETRTSIATHRNGGIRVTESTHGDS